jgi:hypothetical protein
MNIQQMAECGDVELNFTDPFIEDGNASVHGKCIAIESSKCDCKTYSDRYDDASASWVILCAILIFFMVSSIDLHQIERMKKHVLWYTKRLNILSPVE